MATYYCTDADITDLLPTLTGSQIATAAARNTRLRLPARDWVDSVYASCAPFPSVGTNDPTDWLIDGEVDSGDTTAGIDGGTGDPSAGDFFQPEGHNGWYKVVSYSSPTLTFRYVENFNPGIESTTATGAMADIMDNTPLRFGTPYIVRQAAKWYGVSIAYQILRNDPLTPASGEALKRAMDILQVRNGVARAHPFVYYPDSRDGLGSYNPGVAQLVRG